MAGSVKRTMALAALAAPGAAMLCAVGVVVIAQAGAAQTREETAEALAAAMAGQIETAVAREASMLEYLAEQSLPARALRADSPRGLVEQTQRRLASYFPDALGLRLIPAGLDAPDDSATPPIGYADLALIRAAEAGRVPGAAVHRFGSGQAYLVLLRSLPPADGAAPGHLLLYLPTDTLNRWLAAALPAGGYAEMHQVIEDAEPFVFASAGDRTLAGRAPFKVAEIRGTSWRLVVHPAPQLARFGAGALWMLAGVVLLGGVMAGAVVLLIGWRLTRGLRADLALLVGTGRDFAAGQLRENYPTQLAEVTGAAEALNADLRQVAARGAAGQPRPSGEGATPDIDL